MAQAKAQHPDGTQKGISYSLFSGNRKKAFIINSSTGKTLSYVKIVSEFVSDMYKQICSPGEIMVQSSKGLDFEDTPRLRLVVKAESLSSTSFMAINLILQDVNDNLPRFQLQNYVAYMREAQGYDMPIIQVVHTHPFMLVLVFFRGSFGYGDEKLPSSLSRWWLRM